jgi:hypothetical protein
MKYIIFFVLLSISAKEAYCQLFPQANSDSLISSLEVKSISSYYTDGETGKNHLVQKREYNQHGELLNQFQLFLWDVISYSYSTDYTYDENGNKTEELRIQEILDLYPKDSEYIETFGNAPVNDKTILSYDQDGQLIKKEIFVFHTSQASDTISAKRIITYEYEDGRLVEEVSTSPETRIFNYNYSIHYDYDSAGNLIGQERTLGKEKPMKRQTIYKYDSLGLLIEKRVVDSAVPHNNLHEKYEYNEKGQRSKRLEYSDEDKEFIVEDTYRYDDHGNQISGDRDVTFEYYDNGLIKSESWKDPKTKQEITFVSEYQFY